MSEVPLHQEKSHPSTTQGSSRGYLKVNSSETLSIFEDKCPQNGFTKDLMAPRTTLECPHEGPSGVLGLPDRAERCWAGLIAASP